MTALTEAPTWWQTLTAAAGAAATVLLLWGTVPRTGPHPPRHRKGDPQ